MHVALFKKREKKSGYGPTPTFKQVNKVNVQEIAPSSSKLAMCLPKERVYIGVFMTLI